jgi:hypothetical protein
MKYLNVSAEYKALGDDKTGVFSGYASIFGNVDLGGDIVERGAFKEIVANAEGKVTTLWQHDSRQPIGVATVMEDMKGLAFDGALVMEDATARKALAHMKAGSVRGMSIGYDVLPGGAKETEAGVRILTDLKLWEISVVTWGMNPLAQVTAAKDRVKQLSTIRDFEDFLRDEGGFSNAQAKLLASGGWRTLQQARDESGGEGEKDAAKLLNYLTTLTKET